MGGGVLPLFANTDPPIKNTLKSVLGLTSVIILKSVRESIFFQSNTFPACKVEDEKEVAQSLIMFNQRKIFYPFQSIKLKVTNRFKCKCFSVNTHLSVSVTLLYFT